MIHHVFLKINKIYNEADQELGHLSAPIRMHANALKAELNAIKERIPPDLTHYGMSLLFVVSGFVADSFYVEDINSNSLVLRSLQTTEITLNEYALYSSLHTSTSQSDRLNTLYACLIATKTYFSTHLSELSLLMASSLYLIWIQSSYVMLTALKLCACKANGWDFYYAREFLDFSGTSANNARKIESIIKLRGQRQTNDERDVKEKDVFVRYLRHARCLKMWYESMVAAEPRRALISRVEDGTGDSLGLLWQRLEEMRCPDDQAEEGDCGLEADDFMMSIDDRMWQRFYDESVGMGMSEGVF